ncbi:hypothetical protein BZB76_2861 [Actinomadura pelletieri DSM 43383]|uniref:Uncharacterized protein n=1 Tax=Actinomadura pelletieri DSM 43383 TaxID=1120940 RepID=A0A495QMY8_9ACTN|nr:hypothetical protein [Actinomadura pelletieri]RKS74350.1 hypothetical protein BZB76_2861 [Actinomadura pelletieri DSM 43383]
MTTVLVLVSLAALFGLCLPRLLRPMPHVPSRAPSPDPPPHGPLAVHPESMTAELDPADEEYLAFLADRLWPDDEYLEPEPSTDGEEESGGSTGLRR